MIDTDVLSTARGRCSPTDAVLFDRVLVAAQGYDDATRDGVEYLLSIVALSPPGQPFDGVMLPHDSAFDEKDIGDHRSLCGVARERVCERLGVAWEFLTSPLARRPPMPSRLPPIAAECDRAKGIKGAYVDAHDWHPGACDGGFGPGVLDGLFVGRPYATCPGLWSTGGEYDGAHARTPVLVAGSEVICISGGGPGNHFEHMELVEVAGTLWTGRFGVPRGADGRPSIGRRVWAITRTGLYPRAALADTEPPPA